MTYVMVVLKPKERLLDLAYPCSAALCECPAHHPRRSLPAVPVLSSAAAAVVQEGAGPVLLVLCTSWRLVEPPHFEVPSTPFLEVRSHGFLPPGC